MSKGSSKCALKFWLIEIKN